MNLNKIYNEDCIAFMQKLPDAFVDVMVTSPPYNIGKEYSKYEDTKTREDYLAWMENVAVESRRILKEGGSFFLNIGGKPSDLTIPYDVLHRFEKHLKLQNDILWVKAISIGREDIGKSNGFDAWISVGHYKPINSNRFLNNCHENIFHFTKKGNTDIDKLAIGVPYQDKSNVTRWKNGSDKRDRGDVWFIPYETVQKSRPHPATFPEKLPYLCIKLHGIKEGMVVYDPFMGIGTTALAAVKLGVDYIGTDIDESYVKIAEERISEITSQTSLRV